MPYSQLPRPCLKGDALSIKIQEDEYLAGLVECKKHLHGRLFLSEGDAPIKNQDLRAKLCSLWKPIGQQGMISLGKGFDEFYFSSIDDLRNVQSIGI